MSALWDSVDDPGPEPQPATTATPSVTKATPGSTFMGMKYVLPRLACHTSTVSPRPLSRAAVVTLALALASFGCRKSGVECMPPPVVACPDGGGPSFDTDVLPIFQQVCDNCHSPDAPDADREVPYLTNYQQIHGGGVLGTINNEVFTNCAMPPADAPVALDGDRRQTLLAWLACGALDSPAVDAGAAD